MSNKIVFCLSFSLVLFIATTTVFAQQDPATQDPAAKKILDKFTSRAESSYPLEIHFNYLYESQVENHSQTEKGTIIIDRDKFRLLMTSMEVYCDGKTFWNFLPKQNEVYISDPEDAADQDDFLLSDPSRIFTFYAENFKYRYNGENEMDGTDVHEIDLFPFDLNKSYHTIKLRINKDTHQLVSMKTFEKQGVVHSISVTKYTTDLRLDKDIFVFHPENHSDIEVVDTRF